jgi:hypothetical protein
MHAMHSGNMFISLDFKCPDGQPQPNAQRWFVAAAQVKGCDRGPSTAYCRDTVPTYGSNLWSPQDLAVCGWGSIVTA